jgi:hypothetical protein
LDKATGEIQVQKESKGKLVYVCDVEVYGGVQIQSVLMAEALVLFRPQLLYHLNSLNMELTGEDNIKMYIMEAEYEDMN